MYAQSTSPVEALTRTYAENYHRRVVVAMPPHSAFPTDLHVPHTEAEDLMSADHDLQILDLAVKHGSLSLSEEQRERLLGEMADGRCCLQANDDGELLRVMSLVVLRVEDSEGRIFAQLGKV